MAKNTDRKSITKCTSQNGGKSSTLNKARKDTKRSRGQGK
jgi:hypothetical protein